MCVILTCSTPIHSESGQWSVRSLEGDLCGCGFNTAATPGRTATPPTGGFTDLAGLVGGAEGGDAMGKLEHNR